MSVAALVGAGLVAYATVRALQGYARPLPAGSYRVTSAVGPRVSPITGRPSAHDGTDLAAPLGTPVYAVSAGTVQAAGYLGACGYAVVIEDRRYRWSYCHLAQPSAHVVGHYIRRGELLGYVGSTGSSTGPHLHLGVRDRETGAVIDALDLGVPV